MARSVFPYRIDRTRYLWEEMKHNYNSENRCVNCGAYRDMATAEGLSCTTDIPRELKAEISPLRPPMTEYVPGTEPPEVRIKLPQSYKEIAQANLDHIKGFNPIKLPPLHEPVSLGGRVKLLAQAAGLTETGAATVMGCSVRDVAMIVNGQQDITSDQLVSLAVETFKSVYKAYQES